MKLLALICIFLNLFMGITAEYFTKKEFVKQQKCMFLVDPGPCHGNYQVYGFDPFSNICSKFTYGGCGGNPNRFIDYAQCSNDCIVRPKEVDNADSNEGGEDYEGAAERDGDPDYNQGTGEQEESNEKDNESNSKEDSEEEDRESSVEEEYKDRENSSKEDSEEEEAQGEIPKESSEEEESKEKEKDGKRTRKEKKDSSEINKEIEDSNELDEYEEIEPDDIKRTIKIKDVAEYVDQRGKYIKGNGSKE